MMNVDFVSLPTTILTTIQDFCGAQEILALSGTCRMLKRVMESSMLVVNAECRSMYLDDKIPIFFSDQCHSVFLTCELFTPGTDDQNQRFVVLSRKRKQGGDFETRVWERTKYNHDGWHLMFEICFRQDPSREYLLRHEYDQPPGGSHCLRIRKQFMTRAVTPTMKESINTCLKMGYRRWAAWHPMEAPLSLKRFDVLRFFMKLFVLDFESLSEEPSPVRKFFERGPTVKPGTIGVVQKLILNFFEQALEQKEPIHCTKVLPSTKELGKSFPKACPSLVFRNGFKWERCKNEKSLDQDSNAVYNDELIFIARIPLLPETTTIWIDTKVKTDSPTLHPFVIFFQKRQSDLNDLENPMDGQVFVNELGSVSHSVTVDVKPEYEACFFYIVPGDATRLEMKTLEFAYDMKLNHYDYCFRDWMQHLLQGCGDMNPSMIYHRHLPVFLLRAGALALLGPDQGQNAAFKQAFDMEGLNSTPEGLAGIVDICNAILPE